MRTRLLFALAFVVLVSALIVVRDLGFLGGRERGGPLTFGAAGVGMAMKPGRVARFGLGVKLDGGPVRVQNVRPRVWSPEVDILGPTVSERSIGAARARRWPPPWAVTPLEDATLRGPAPAALMGLRAKRPGIYYALGLRVDYRRGQRRFRRSVGQLLCISVGKGQECDIGYHGPGDARVAQLGGPSRYPGATLTPTTASYGEAGEYRLQLTVANQTRSVIDVSDVALDRNGLGVVLDRSRPIDFHLSAHGYQVLRLRVRVPACRPFGITFDRLRAKLDGERRSIPLSLPLHFGCG
jgi:hypothetical protein